MKDNIRLLLFALFLGLILLHPMGLNKLMSQHSENMNHQESVTKKEPSIQESHSDISKSTRTAVAYFAGGCFWCMEPVFDVIKGVMDTTVGYMGGKKETANYTAVSSGTTNHYEVIKVTYNPKVVSYQTLLMAFWRSIDPTDENGQFADQGPHYRTAIFIKNESDQAIVDASIKTLLSQKSYDKPIATQIIPEQPFYTAEDHHQNYYQKNAVHYNAYKVGSGRAGYLNQTWGNTTDK